jgi:hypothetical protein
MAKYVSGAVDAAEMNTTYASLTSYYMMLHEIYSVRLDIYRYPFIAVVHLDGGLMLEIY